METINLLAVLLAAVAYVAIGAVWYCDGVFGKVWRKLSGITKKTENKIKKTMASSYFLAFLSSLIMSYILANAMILLGAETLLDGLSVAFWIWLGFVATLMLGGVLWEGKSPKLYLINSGQALLGMLIMGGILASW